MKTILFPLVVFLVASSCAGSFELIRAQRANNEKFAVTSASTSRDPALDTECKSLDRDHKIFSTLAVIGGAAAGGGGITSLSVDDKGIKIGLSITSVVIAIGTALVTKLSSDTSEEYVGKCTK